MTARKIAAATVQNRTQTPFWEWLKQKCLAVDRQPITPPPGIPGLDGKAQFNNPCRFPNSQAARPGSAELPTLPGGIHHKIEANYYFTRDGRREVVPPKPIYAASSNGVQFGTQSGKPIHDAVKVNIGPDQNFGLQAPTPGFGAVWSRSRETELETQKQDPSLANVERFDKYAHSQ